VNDRLEQLLKRADAPPPIAGESNVAARVRRRARRNDRIRSTAGVAVLLIGLAIAAKFALQPRFKKQPVALAPDPAAVKAELARLNSEATRHAEIADRRMQIELSPQVSNEVEVKRDLQRQRDEAALSLIYQAETLAPVPAQRPAAVALYQKAIDLFPQTHWASLAKQRIEALQSGQENL
jgi:hypothetical protein